MKVVYRALNASNRVRIKVPVLYPNLGLRYCFCPLLLNVEVVVRPHSIITKAPRTHQKQIECSRGDRGERSPRSGREVTKLLYSSYAPKNVPMHTAHYQAYDYSWMQIAISCFCRVSSHSIALYSEVCWEPSSESAFGWSTRS
jgi:hypothetical protein